MVFACESERVWMRNVWIPMGSFVKKHTHTHTHTHTRNREKDVVVQQLASENLPYY